jgi:CheY-like chemotaxis protein
MDKKDKILIVEDDTNTQILYKALLNEKYDLSICDSVSSAKQYLKANGTVKLVLLDLSLKGEEDGLVLAEYIRSSNKGNKIIILAVTAHAFTFDKERCLATGCNDFLTKPLKGKKLLDHIESVLSPLNILK